MTDLRNRISITLTDAEYAEVVAASEIMGIKPTRVVYECVKGGLSGVLNEDERRRDNAKRMQALKSQIDWTDAAEQRRGMLKK